MNVDEYLSKFFKGTDKPTLRVMNYFMEEFNHPEEELKIIHVGGTNGKGGSVVMIADILINAGYKVGKYISPHLIKYNERISIQNNDITDKEREELLNLIIPKIEKYQRMYDNNITFFEIETTMAILHFFRQKCDFVILEVGLGGALDATNVVKPLISIITSIGYDHMNILGNDIISIADNKFGIIKPDSITIYAQNENESVNNRVIKKCKDINNELHIVNFTDIKNYSYTPSYQAFDYKGYKQLLINLKGRKEVYNACLVIECMIILKQLGYSINDYTIRSSLKKIIHKARFEKLSDNPVIIYEGGHNKDAISNFINSLKMYYNDKEKVYIIQLLKTKDYKSVIDALLEYDTKAIYIFTDGNSIDRYIPKEILYNYAKKENIEAYTFELNTAVNTAINEFSDRVIFILGSFYIYSDVLKIIGVK